MKVAIVHDFLNQFGGAERVIATLKEVFPEAPIYTSFYISEHLPPCFKRYKIVTSFMQRFPFLRSRFKDYFFLYPFAMRQFDLRSYDCILSSSSSFAKGIRVPKNAMHICYCYTPPRFLWRKRDYFQRDPLGLGKQILLEPFLEILKKWDLESSKNVDHFVAISRTIQNRIKKIYNRDSEVIYPPVNVDYFRPNGEKSENYYLVISRLVAYKRLDLVIEAFNQLKYPLRIIGRGLHEKSLKRRSGATIQFLGAPSDDGMLEQIRGCKALIFPGEEDFGIVPVEANACGKPVIAFASGGALETVKDHETGLFFNKSTADSLIVALKKFERMVFQKGSIRKHSEQFSTTIFKTRIDNFVRSKYEERIKKGIIIKR